MGSCSRRARTRASSSAFAPAAPGRFFIKVQDVYYTAAGRTYHQPLPIGFRGHVVAGATPIRRPRYEQRCLALTHGLPLFGPSRRS
jgi:hypothetical protein